MPSPENIVRQWIETIWNAGDLDQIDRFHPPIFDNKGQPSTPTEAAPGTKGCAPLSQISTIKSRKFLPLLLG